MSTTAATVISCFLKKSFARVCVCVWGGGQETPTTQPCTPREKERWLAREESARSTPQQTF